MKKKIRNEILTKRDLLSNKEIINKSMYIFNRLKENSIFQNAHNIMLFVNFKTEVSTREIIEDLLSQKKRVFIPLTVPETREIIVSELLDPKKDLILGNFNVLEPKEDAIRPVDPNILDLVIVPGVAFDKKGYRIGYGGGYYDRFLAKLPSHIPTISIAYELQLIDEVPIEPHDIPVQYIITENEFIEAKS